MKVHMTTNAPTVFYHCVTILNRESYRPSACTNHCETVALRSLA